jgi:hypothetical protein
MLSLYRRHLKKCPHRKKGREYTKCSCPIWADGYLNDEDYRRSLKTRDWQRAIRLAEQLERPNAERLDLVPCEKPGCNTRVAGGRCVEHRNGLDQAVTAFLAARSDMAHGTLRKYKRTLKFFQAHAEKAGLEGVDKIKSGAIDVFRTTRAISTLTWTKELEILRQFFRYCVQSGWMAESPAAAVKMPKNIKPTDKEPYSRNDIINSRPAT